MMSKAAQASVLFLGQKRDPGSQKAAQFCQRHFADSAVCMGYRGDLLPERAAYWRGDYILSYGSPWAVPDYLLERAQAAISISPTPPERRGVGCASFALYEESASFGVTAHHMEPTVCSGPIIAVREFPVMASDTLTSLVERVRDFQLVLFYEIAGSLVSGRALPECHRDWSGIPTTQADFDELRRIDPAMTHDEIARRVRAITTADQKPTVEVDGWVFELQGEAPEWRSLAAKPSVGEVNGIG